MYLNGKLTSVSITNITSSPSDDAVIRVFNPVSEKAVLMGRYMDATELPVRKTESPSIYEITIPDLKSWAVTRMAYIERYGVAISVSGICSLLVLKNASVVLGSLFSAAGLLVPVAVLFPISDGGG